MNQLEKDKQPTRKYGHKYMSKDFTAETQVSNLF